MRDLTWKLLRTCLVHRISHDLHKMGYCHRTMKCESRTRKSIHRVFTLRSEIFREVVERIVNQEYRNFVRIWAKCI